MKVRLRSRILEEGFSELIDLVGNIHNDIFIKEVDIDDVNIIYNLEYKVIYKGKEFVPWAIGKFILETDKIPLGTSDDNDAKNYGFKKMEQFVFKKEVLIDEVDALIEIKKPILKFKHIDEEVRKIDKKDIRSYLNNILE